jgi:hypothetical protein
MFKPETSITGFGDSVIVLTDDRNGLAFGTYTGNCEAESYEIRVEDVMSGEMTTAYFHKEDIFENTQENLERVREIV